MTVATIYHVTPITPVARLLSLGPRCFCVSHFEPKQMRYMPRVGAWVMLDNGAFSYFTQMVRIRKLLTAKPDRADADRLRRRLEFLEMPRDWSSFYSWCEEHVFHPGRWAVIPDVIAEGSQAQDALLAQWPFGHRGAPVWHTGEPIDRLLRLLDAWPRVCIGSTDEHWQVGSPIWRARLDEAWAEIAKRHKDPVVHMLRGTDVADLYPFHSADSSSVGQNGHRYSAPLFAGTDEEHRGSGAYADVLERRRKGRGRAQPIDPSFEAPGPFLPLF